MGKQKGQPSGLVRPAQDPRHTANEERPRTEEERQQAVHILAN